MELHLTDPSYLKRINFQNGRFQKGHIPFNKGMKQSDWISPERISKVLEKLKIGRDRGNPEIAGWNKKPVVAVHNMRIVAHFESACEASRKTGIERTNISKVCRREDRKRAGGFYWFFESDYKIWITYINQN